MIHFARRPLRFLVLTLLAVGATLLSAQTVWACEVLDRYGDTRPCTFLEEYGECLWGVLDAHEDCLDRAERLVDELGCHVGTQVDLAVCNLGMPIDFISRVLNPFDR